MVKFTGDPRAPDFFAPERFEASLYDCEVTGKIPRSLTGAFVRVSTEWLYPPRFQHDAVLSADGLVSMFRFEDGIVDFTARWVRTEHWERNRAAGRQLYGLYRNPYTDDPAIRAQTLARPASRTVANTNVMAHAGKLFAMKEDGLPYELDPVTLATRGTLTFAGGYESETFSAHPKVDPVSGEMIAYGYEAEGLASNAIHLYSIGRDGRVTRKARISAPYVSMVHDIAVTQQHVIFPVLGFETSRERLEAGKIHWAWNARLPSYFGILPRDGDARELRWFKGPPREMIHTFNAWTEGRKVILESPVGESNPFPFFPPEPGNEDSPAARRGWDIRRYIFDLDSRGDGFEEEVVHAGPIGPFGRIDERYLTVRNRYVYEHFTDAERPIPEGPASRVRARVTNCYGRFDMHTGAVSAYYAGPTHSLHEPVFVPCSLGSPEGEGYVIGVADNLAEMRSELVIADAERLEEGDVARVILPFRLGPQVHGNWIPADRLPLDRAAAS